MVPTENVMNLMNSKETVLRETDKKRSLINRMHKYQATFFCPLDEKGETRTSCVNWNDGRKIQQGKPEKMLGGLTKGLKVGQVTDALNATKDRNGRKVIIAYA